MKVFSKQVKTGLPLRLTHLYNPLSRYHKLYFEEIVSGSFEPDQFFNDGALVKDS